jgi:hypothetical protein
MARGANALALKLLEVETQIRAIDDSGKTLRGTRAELREKLLALVDLPLGVDVVVGSVRIRRREVAGRVTYDIAEAIEADAIAEASLRPFEHVGDPYEVWTVKPATSPKDAAAVADQLLG